MVLALTQKSTLANLGKPTDYIIIIPVLADPLNLGIAEKKGKNINYWRSKNERSFSDEIKSIFIIFEMLFFCEMYKMKDTSFKVFLWFYRRSCYFSKVNIFTSSTINRVQTWKRQKIISFIFKWKELPSSRSWWNAFMLQFWSFTLNVMSPWQSNRVLNLNSIRFNLYTSRSRNPWKFCDNRNDKYVDKLLQLSNVMSPW